MRKNRRTLLVWILLFAMLWLLPVQTVRAEAVEAGELQTEITIEEKTKETENQQETDVSDALGTEGQSESTSIKAAELDLGEYQTEMSVGSRQLLTVTVLPTDASEQTLTYESDNKKVAEINGMGRITAKTIGTAKITVSCGSVTESFRLKVVEKLSEEETETIPVTDIEISDYEEKLEVDKTMTLVAAVVPSNATESIITYSSSNPAVATVNSSGEVKGIAKGEVIIYCSAGNVKKEAHINVFVATERLSINNDYLVMKPGSSFSLKATVTPSEASSELTYKSADNSVAFVSANGTVTAKKCGSTSILVSNQDTNISVSVIVNENEQTAADSSAKPLENKNETKTYPNHIKAEETFLITPDMLKYYYQGREQLEISGEGYTIFISGSDICNYENELYTQIPFRETPEGIVFEINHGKELCGEVDLELTKYAGNYLYLYNASKDRYQLLQTDNISRLHITQEGTYLLTKEKLANHKIKRAALAGSVGILLIMGIVYIGVKRKYWFW